ncbi:MAG TPA: SirB2 family protein [Bacteroidia bacterium]|nr:SirB2 family protein [Bacteroidia bacterium]HNT79428.1 SirB2 family protein [Bacteroidia bacterium]
MLHTHKLVVIIFLILAIIRFILMMSGNQKALDSFVKKFKVPDMIISTLFLLTGIYLSVYTGNKGMWLWVKIAAIVLTIVLAVIGYKKQNKLLVFLSVLCLVYVYGISETKSPVFKMENKSQAFENVSVDQLGQSIFESQCIVCHGADGKLGVSGAKDLTQSKLSAEERLNIIRNGKNSMIPYQKVLSEEQILAVAEYVETLK